MNWNRPSLKFKMSATKIFPAPALRIGKADLLGQRREAWTNPLIRWEPMCDRESFQNDLRLDRGRAPQVGRISRRSGDRQEDSSMKG